MGQLSTERMQQVDAISHKYFDWLSVLGDAGIKEVQDLQGQYLLKCPFHPDKRPSFRIRVHEHNYHCFSCNGFGSVLKLMWKLSNTTMTQAQFYEQVLKRTPGMQAELGFNSIYLDAMSLDSGFNTRRTFDPSSHIGSTMPLSVLSRRIRSLGDTWENLVYSLTMLQLGESPDSILAQMNKITNSSVAKASKTVSLLELLEDEGLGHG